MPNENNSENMSNWQILLEILTESAFKIKLFNHLEDGLRNVGGVVEFLSRNSNINHVLLKFIDDYEESYKGKTGKNQIKSEELYQASMRSLKEGNEMLYWEQLTKANLSAPPDADISKEIQKLQMTKKEKRPSSSSPTLEQNLAFPMASKRIRLSWSIEKGRHVVCAEDVRMGDLLFVEAPSAAIVNQSFHNKFCHQCCLRIFHQVPCENCCEIAYCSVECRDKSWQGHHRLECGYLTFLQSIGVAHLALRCLLVAGADYSELAELLPTLSGGEEGGLTGYKALYHLQYHENNLQPEELFQYALTALLLTHFLHKRKYFGNSVTQVDRNLVGVFLLRHILQLVVNAHAVVYNCLLPSESSEPPVPGASVLLVATPSRVATGIYPSTAMMNHSCDPSVVNR